MKTKFLSVLLSASLLFTACSKDNEPKISFSNNQTSGTANGQGEFTLTGHISSETRLDKVTLTMKGQSTPFLVDESEAKNKNEYDFVYPITGITATTTVVLRAYDQDNDVTTAEFEIRK